MLKGFGKIPFGSYYCRCEYDGPRYPTATGQKEFSDGNSLPGSFESNIIEVEYSADKNCVVKNRNVIIL